MQRRNIIIILITVIILCSVLLITALAGYNKKVNNNKHMLEAAYNSLDKAVTQLVNDKSLYPDKKDPKYSKLANTDTVELNGIKYGGETKFCQLLAVKMESRCHRIIFQDKNDFFWFIPTTTFMQGKSTGGASVMVDVDYSRERQKKCIDGAKNCKNPNMFIFTIEKDGTINIVGEYGPKYLKIIK